MRVIEPPRKERIEIIARNQANKECETCPCCGKSFFDEKSCIVREEKMHTKSHPFWGEKYYTTEYHCLHCGCKYETEPYNSEAYPSEKYDVILIFYYIASFCCCLCGFKKLIAGIIGIIWLITTIIMTYLYMNTYKKHNQKTEFKPYNVYK